jgi:hypothetical protein
MPAKAIEERDRLHELGADIVLFVIAARPFAAIDLRLEHFPS